jgi:chloramphenicol 3-O-phosphotransferase
LSNVASAGRPLRLEVVDRLMNSKDRAIAVINSLGDNVTLDDVIDRLYLVRKIELGIAQADAGDVMEHEQFMVELEREDAK